MNSDYVAWNGERYVWPPPDGWYLAADGRWWAADTGPDLDSPSTDATSVMAPNAAVDHGQSPDPDLATPQAEQTNVTEPTVTEISEPSFQPSEPGTVDPTEQPVSVFDNIDPPSEGGLDHVPTTGARTAAPAGGMGTQEHVAVDVANDVTTDTARNTGQQSAILAEAQAPPAKVKRNQTLPIVAAGLLVTAALGIAALLALFSGDDEDPQQQPSASLETDGEPGQLVVTTEGEGDAMSEDGDAMSEGDAMEDGDAMAEEGTPDSSTTTLGEGASDEAVLIGQFRTLLEDNQITAAELTGEDLSAFGATACTYAETSEDTASYEQTRSEVLEGAQNDELAAEDLQFIVDAAVTVFCPDDATRLGITLGTE